MFANLAIAVPFTTDIINHLIDLQKIFCSLLIVSVFYAGKCNIFTFDLYGGNTNNFKWLTK